MLIVGLYLLSKKTNMKIEINCKNDIAINIAPSDSMYGPNESSITLMTLLILKPINSYLNKFYCN